MDKVTQSTAAISEENASAAEELSAQAVSLDDIVSELDRLITGTRVVHEAAATPASAPAIAPATPAPGVVSPRLPARPGLNKVSSDAEEKAFADSFR